MHGPYSYYLTHDEANPPETSFLHPTRPSDLLFDSNTRSTTASTPLASLEENRNGAEDEENENDDEEDDVVTPKTATTFVMSPTITCHLVEKPTNDPQTQVGSSHDNHDGITPSLTPFCDIKYDIFHDNEMVDNPDEKPLQPTSSSPLKRFQKYRDCHPRIKFHVSAPNAHLYQSPRLMERRMAENMTTTHYGTKLGHFETSIIHFPTSEGASKVSERANK